MRERPYIIGIAGPSCAGKSLLAAGLAENMPGAVILPLDSYYHDLIRLSPAQRASANFDAPAAFEYTLFNRHVRDLAHGIPIDRPVYDFTTHTRKRETVRVEPAGVIIIEGLFALYWPESRLYMNLKIFVTVPDPVCLDRRQRRDMAERGRTAESVAEQYRQTVAPMFETYCRPTLTRADIVLDGREDPERLVKTVLEHIPASR